MVKNRYVSRDPRVLRSLQYFEAVARLGSIKAAAEENRVSASAVSHQLRELRTYLGEEILVRSGRGIRLTAKGDALYDQVSRLFADLDSTLGKTVGDSTQLIRIAACSSFGPYWLAKRLNDMQEQLPGIDVELRLFTIDPLQSENTADMIITADDVQPGFEAVTLFEEMLVAVISPEAPLDQSGRPVQLITTDIDAHIFAEDWKDYGAVTQVDYLGAAEKAPMRCSHYLLARELARSGGGAALVPDFLVLDALYKGDLRLLRPEKLQAKRVYKLCYKTLHSRNARIRSVVNWITMRAKEGAVPSGALTKLSGAPAARRIG
jgi:DNA-binding transcriptional LysR family regulator